MGRILEDAEIAFLKSCAEAREKAVRAAAKEIQTDFKAKVFDQAVSDYYEDYKPKRYKRKEKLYKAFKVSTNTDGVSIAISYDWDFNRLPQYKSNSKYHKKQSKYGEWISRDDSRFNWEENDEGEPIGNNGIPEKGWIFENFMEGIHPKFYFDPNLDIVLNKSEEFEPSYLRIKQYKDNYIKNGDAKDILLKHLKKQCKNL